MQKITKQHETLASLDNFPISESGPLIP